MTTTDRSLEHYLIVKGYKHPDGSLHYFTDSDAGYSVMLGRPIYDDDLEDFIRLDDATAETDHRELYDGLEHTFNAHKMIEKIIAIITTTDTEISDGETLDNIFELLRDAGYRSDGGKA